MRCVRRLIAGVTLGWCFSVSSSFAYRTAGDLSEFSGTEKVRWGADALGFVLVDDFPSQLGGVDEQGELVRVALRSWNSVSCSSLFAGYDGVTGKVAEFGDGINSIQYLSEGWVERGFEPGAAGASDVRYQEVDGLWEIVEADVYLNVADHEWTSGSGTDAEREVAGVLVHELGHALGLLHPCVEPGRVGEGPACESAFEVAPTMHPAYSHGQLSLEPDDVSGLCFLYPACVPGSCEAGESCEDSVCRELCGETTCDQGLECMEGECRAPDSCLAGGEPCDLCDTDADCSLGARCLDARCVYDARPAGDPCADADECSSSLCLMAGYCGLRCASDDDCGSDGECDPERGTCVDDERVPFGGRCESANACLSDRCLADLTEEPVCTRACGASAAPCPFGWVCGEVDSKNVCVPPDAFGAEFEPASGCGCRTAGSRASFPDAPVALFALATLSALLAFRRRRSLTDSRSLSTGFFCRGFRK